VILDIGSPDIMSSRSYMAEAGYWTQTDEEAANLPPIWRRRLHHLRRLPGAMGHSSADEARAAGRADVELDISHPIFHSFFDVATLDFVQFYGRGEKPYFMAPTRATTRRSGCCSSRTTTTTSANTGVLGHRLDAHRSVQRGVQVGRELHRVRADALGRSKKQEGN